ncbi:phosphoribosylformylglycinamidine cyclo-ligase [bacterium]
MLTYKKAGVDISKGDKLVDKIKMLTKHDKKNKSFLGGLGGFGGAYALGSKYKNPVLVSGTDGVGTKLKLAFLLNKHDSIGIDLVAMCVNDIITIGAKPLFFLDYFATGKLSLKKGQSIIKGIVDGTKQSGCVLLGGETAEMPDFYEKGEYDLAGFVVGVIEKSKIIDGKSVKPGDVVIGLKSSGIHSNGYSLVRKVFNEKELKKYGKQLIAPTKIYVKDVLKLTDKGLVKACAHITGGGLEGNVVRVLNKKIDVVINKECWKIPEVFQMIRKKGKIAEKEMFRVFNMGIGMVIVVSKKDVAKVNRTIKDSIVIGEVIKGNGKAVLN